MKILVINAGSSSLKYQLIDAKNNTLLAKGLCERIGIDGRFKHNVADKEYLVDLPMPNHTTAIENVVKALTSREYGVIDSMSEISAVGHRVVHGGEKFSGAMLIDDVVIKGISDCVEISPLHNPHNLTGIRACAEIMKGVPQVAVFDTSFHQTMPDYAYMYALPYEFYEKYRIRRYGFHGTSHKYVSGRAAKILGKDINDLKIITCHLGNGSSITAIKDGISVDTSMGLTPLEGIMMGTRCGSIDPAIISFIMEKKGITVKQMDDIMNKKSGILGVSGVSSDFRDIEIAIEQGNERAHLATEMFCYQVKKYIGAYCAAMGGLDAIVFTAGIGENNSILRNKICEGLDFFGIELDLELNKQRGKELDISTKTAKVRVLTIPTNEELVIALDTKNIIEKLQEANYVL